MGANTAKAGYMTVDSIDWDNPAKVLQRMVEINKKYKLGITMPSVDAVAAWQKPSE